MRFRAKLMFSYVLLVLLVSGSFYFFFEHNLQQELVEESRGNLMSQAELVRLLVQKEGVTTSPQLLVEKIGAAVKSRVTLIALDGKVIGDSDVGQARVGELQNHLGRPEIQSAIKNGSGSAVRYSETIRRDMLYVALPVERAGAGFVRLALPLDYLAIATMKLQTILSAVTMLTLLAALVLSYIFSNITSRPIREIAAAAARMGKGEPGVILDTQSSDEVGELADILNAMSRRTDSQMKNLILEKQRLDTILNGMGEGVMVASGDGTILLVNPAFRTLFSIGTEIEGKNLIEISRHPDLIAAFHELRSSGDELVREINIPAAGFTLLTHWSHMVVNGNDQGIVAVFHDISDMKRVENMRRDFVANVSHELRTPVSVIKGYAETLLDGLVETDPERSRRFIGIILNHSERLASLINDILTLSHLESKDTSLELHALDLGGAIQKAGMLLQETAARKNIVIRDEKPAAAPKVMADQGRLEQVLVNLLENAVKYTPEGGTIRIFTEDEGAFIRISVADTGIGIPFKDIGRIFERFYRIDEARSREQGGTGLGLAIVKHIVQLHGGDVSVISEQGKGSVFSFTLRKG